MSEDRLYDSRAMVEQDWLTLRTSLANEGWEHRPVLAGVVYLRKHLTGFLNTSAGWTLCSVNDGGVS